MCLRIAEVDQNPVAHVLRYEPAEALHKDKGFEAATNGSWHSSI
jgi:hypothetical protein